MVDKFSKSKPLDSGIKTVPTTTAEKIITSTTVEYATALIMVSDDGAATNGNTAIVYIGPSDITVGGGIGIRPGASKVYDISNPAGTSFLDFDEIYCISGVAGQKLMWELYG